MKPKLRMVICLLAATVLTPGVAGQTSENSACSDLLRELAEMVELDDPKLQDHLERVADTCNDVASPCHGPDPIYTVECTADGLIREVIGSAPGVPTVQLSTSVEAANPSAGHTCTGTYKTVAKGTAGGKAEVGVGVFEFEVSASVTTDLLTHYTFACDAAMVATASGIDGVMRAVYVQAGNSRATERMGPVCEYTGLSGDSSCTTNPYQVLADAYSGQGIAGPLGGGGFWPKPTAIKVCPPSDWYAQAYNRPWQGLGVEAHDGPATWKCQAFSIHYNASLQQLADNVEDILAWTE